MSDTQLNPTNKPMIVTDETFEAAVMEYSKEMPVVVDFWAEWCPPCRMVAPILDKLAAEYEGRVRIAKVDTDANQGLSQAFQIMSIPTIMIVKDGHVIFGQPGALPEPVFRDLFDKAIELDVAKALAEHAAAQAVEEDIDEEAVAEAPAKAKRGKKGKTAAQAVAETVAEAPAKAKRGKKAKAAEAVAETVEAVGQAVGEAIAEAPTKAKRSKKAKTVEAVAETVVEAVAEAALETPAKAKGKKNPKMTAAVKAAAEKPKKAKKSKKAEKVPQ